MASKIVIPDELLESARKLGFRGVYDYLDSDGNDHVRFKFNRNYHQHLIRFQDAIRSLAVKNGVSFQPIDKDIDYGRRTASVEFTFPKGSATAFLTQHLSLGALHDLNTPEGWLKQVVREARTAVDKLIKDGTPDDALPATGWRKFRNNTAYVGSVAMASAALTGKAAYDQFAYEGKAAAEFLEEHFNPVESFRHSAHVRMLDYHDRVGIRLDRFRQGNKVEFADTIFSEKVQIREQLKGAFTRFKSEHVDDLKNEKIYEANRKQLEMKLRTARQDMPGVAKEILDRAKNGKPLTTDEQVFVVRWKDSPQKAMKFGASVLRRNIRQELDAEKATHIAMKRATKLKAKSWKRDHKHTQYVLASQRANTTTKWVHEMAKQLRQAQKQGYTLGPIHQRLLDTVDSIGERRAARAIKAEIDADIRADKVNFHLASASLGSPTHRFLARLNLVSDEAVMSVKNIGRNVAEATVYAGNRTEAAVQLGFDVAVDYAQGTLHSAYEGVKAAAHAATVKPLKAAMGKAF